MQNRVDYSVEMRFTPSCPRDAAGPPPLLHAGTLLLGAAPPVAGEATAYLCGDGVQAELKLVCRRAPHGQVQLSGQAWLSEGTAPAPAAPEPAGAGAQAAPVGRTFRFELAPGETRPCVLRLGPRPAGGPGAEIRLWASNVTLDTDPGPSIAARAAMLGVGLTGAAISGCEAVPGGHRVRYEHADMYFSPAGGAHELYGAVRDKYGALGGPGGDLGLPLTGIQHTPDGQGRCAHFTGGSVYWHPDTGPMALRGALREAWGAAGWERGPLGYPTSDELTTGHQPQRRYATFQNGVLLAPDTGAPAPALAGLSAEQVRAALDRALRREAGDLQPGPLALVGVSPTGADFQRSRGRVLTFRLTGGAEVGSPSGSGFAADLPLLFEAVPSSDTPGWTRVQARLCGPALFQADGPDPHGTVWQLREGIGTVFGRPAALFEVPEAAGFLALIVLPGGALSLAFRPDVLGRLAAQAAQGQLDDLQF